MRRGIPVLMMAFTGVLIFAAFVTQDVRLHPDLEARDLPWAMILRYAAGMVLGGALSGFLCGGLFGRSGAGGWLIAVVGGIVAALIAGLLGSAAGVLPDLMADGFQTRDAVMIAAGLFVLPLSVIEQPLLLLPLAGLIGATHLWTRARRSAA